MKAPHLLWLLGLALTRTSFATVLPRAKPSEISPITFPVAASWFYMSDDTSYNDIPIEWTKVKFNTTDVLLVGPAGIQPNGQFGLYNSTTTGPLAKRFSWLIRAARAQNPQIKIIITQWTGNGTGVWGGDFTTIDGYNSTVIDKYAYSVAKFMQDWSGVTGGINGYNLYYTYDNAQYYDDTLFSNIKKYFSLQDGRYYTFLTPYASMKPLGKSQNNGKRIDYLAVPNDYTGPDTTEFAYIHNHGFAWGQMLVGYCPEIGCTGYGGHSLNETEALFERYAGMGFTLGGINTYRLNSANYQYEDAQQAKVYDFLQSHVSPSPSFSPTQATSR